MAEKVVNRRLNIYIDQATAEQSLERLTKKERDLTLAIEKQTKAGKDATKQMNDLAATQQRIGDIKQVIEGKALPSIRMAEAAVQKLNRELKQLPASSEAAGRKLQELRRAEATLEAVREKALGVNKALDGMKAGGLSSLLDTAKGVFLGGGLLGIAESALAGLQSFFQGAVDEALQAEEATARFKAQLDNLGRSDAFDRLTQAADDFAQQFRFLDNDEIIGVFEKLIDYGKLTEAQIKQLTPVIIDFAAKQRIDLGTATEVITKALEGNGKALKSFGVDIKDAKDTAEAFGVIMDQLKPKVEGAANAFGETTAGQIAITRQEIANLQEDIGTKLLPSVELFFRTVSDGVSWVQRLFKDGSIFSERTQFGANVEARQNFLKQLEQDFEQQSKERQLRLLKGQAEFLKSLGEQVKGASGKQKQDLFRQFQEEAALFNKYNEILGRNDGRTIGVSSPGTDKDKPKGTTKTVKDNTEQVRRDLIDVLNRTEEATAPILAAYRKINEQAEQDILKIKAALAKGLISPEEAQNALDGVERVLNEARDGLNAKFKQTSGFLDNIPGLTDMDAEMERDVKENGKAIGAKAGQAIKDGVKVELGDESTDPVGDWFSRNFDNIQFVLSGVGQLADAFTLLGDARANADQAALDRELANDQKRKDSNKDLLDKKLISQQEYDKRIANINKKAEDREREFRKRQFERDKNAQTVQALMGAASAVVSTLAARPGSVDILSFGAVRAIQIGLIAATTAAQVAAIRSAKPPQFEKGGFIPGGSSHAQGGISLVDNRTGARVGEVEGGEPILSRKTYARNKPLIDALMAASQSGTGMLSMNVPRLIQARQTVFENGGFIPRSGDVQDNGLASAVNSLNQILSTGIVAKVLYGEYEDKADRINNIRNQSIVS